MASKKPSFPICWKPKAKSPDCDSQDKLLFIALRYEPKDIFLCVWEMEGPSSIRKRTKKQTIYGSAKAMTQNGFGNMSNRMIIMTKSPAYLDYSVETDEHIINDSTHEYHFLYNNLSLTESMRPEKGRFFSASTTLL